MKLELVVPQRQMVPVRQFLEPLLLVAVVEQTGEISLADGEVLGAVDSEMESVDYP